MSDRPTDGLHHLRDAFMTGGWDAPADGCPDQGTLWDSAAGTLDPEADEAVLLHLARCGACAASWRLAHEMISPGVAENTPVVPLGAHRRHPPWRRPALLAAAAVVAAGLGLTTALLVHRGQPAFEPVYREQAAATTLQADPETLQLSRTNCLLRWTPGPEGTRYDLTVTDDDLSLLYTRKGLVNSQVLVPPEAIPPGTAAILWRITAHLPTGGVISSPTFRSDITD